MISRTVYRSHLVNHGDVVNNICITKTAEEWH